ncbi:dehydrodolichyl diphosphate synthase complex subunit Nus1 [Bombus vosnesenskii]|uniref:ditrans,polycis-polyprenyl diphosphate synthase [(2E,6E)-farnesyldiphosphate specific] n=3 Tax=Pyrobombus TaxID=144703 RepID=A0A6J3L2B5_9HYME|nr:dehydrodolichyl diphosphate synthase complex subunit Nus1 [Bombus impatiens]XP_033196849.1 dehydrodolichyl diphosphate synthase complex subunit Nus1 [Bombus vancouverensis nearcticus]XP_033310695.1 dehydrodolichyl diphosphate synthase complex subunit Nus1 [Bombus bifarius]XP_033359410.1 dehydrodolichyl diphosphate synthase complex subunit Nus1 [Bombus vosnesenskii]XP_050494172.1 dehydrodolichyl diphosphate synthase complex subunit Nus1 [Bombus huntii]
MFTVFRMLLTLIHFSCDLFAGFYNCCMIVHRKCTEIWYRENLRTETEMLTRVANEMKKLPRHLVIIFGAKEDTVFDCIRIIGWCITLGIPYISFFDISGYLVRNENLLKYELAKRRPDLLDRISWSKPNAGFTQNGITDFKLKTRISLLCASDGKKEIVSLTKTLAEAVVTGTIKPEEINIDLLNEKLNSRGIPDPDMGLIYGRLCSTYGVLPWQTRITEFYTLPLHVSLSAKDFTCLLEKYSKSEQRFGK